MRRTRVDHLGTLDRVDVVELQGVKWARRWYTEPCDDCGATMTWGAWVRFPASGRLGRLWKRRFARCGGCTGRACEEDLSRQAVLRRTDDVKQWLERHGAGVMDPHEYEAKLH